MSEQVYSISAIQGISLFAYFKLKDFFKMYIININATPIKIKQVMIHKNVNTASNL